VFQSDDLSYKFLGFRGFSRAGDYGNRVRVTLDGHTLNDDQLGASYVSTDSLADLQDVQRIEVVRGPGSALYGTNAFFGVINVVTRDGQDVPRPHASITGDGLGTLRARAGAGVGGEELGAWASAVAVTGQGGDYVFPELADLPRGGGVAIDADGVNAANLQGKAWAGDWTLQAFYVGNRKRFPSGAYDTIVGDPRASNGDYRSFGELRFEPELGESARFYGRAYVDYYTYAGDFPYGVRYIYSDRWKGTWVGAEPRVVTSPADWLTLTGGLELVSHLEARLYSVENRALDGSLPPYDADPDAPGTQNPLDENPTSNVISGYAVGEVAFAPVRLSAGARYDVFQSAFARTFSSFNPRIAAVVSGGRDVLKALAGTAFRAPSPYEFLYNDGGLSQVPADADTLSPERIASAELEYSHRFGDAAVLTLATYGNQIDDLVELANNPDDLLQYTNATIPVRTAGAEWELRREWRQGWMASVQESFQHTRSGDLVEGDSLDNSPAHLFALKGAAPIVPGTTWASTRFRVESPRQLRDEEQTEWVYLWDLTVTGEIPVIRSEYGLGVRNLLDWEVNQPTGDDLRMGSVPLPGRTLFATLQFEL
jgi:outer membrane receptor protein involved in Fe transport